MNRLIAIFRILTKRNFILITTQNEELDGDGDFSAEVDWICNTDFNVEDDIFLLTSTIDDFKTTNDEDSN